MPTITIELTDLQYKIMRHSYGNPAQHMYNIVEGRAKSGIKELAEFEITRRYNDPTWTEPIPADYETILNEMEIKSQKEMADTNTEYTLKLVENPDYANTHEAPCSFYPKKK
jgi:hypothetical protein